MKQTARIISTYSADVFGVCSALFELGGMVIMHDASGCNSTYTTHDEPRWYDMESMVYISGLSEMEAIMGDDEKLIGDIVDAAEALHPSFIAIAGTPIPIMTGFDFSAVASVIEQRTGILLMVLGRKHQKMQVECSECKPINMIMSSLVTLPLDFNCGFISTSVCGLSTGVRS